MNNSIRSAGVVLLCGSILLSISLGIRHSFGLFLTPMSIDLGWGREVFALSIAIQNLVWGITQPFAGRFADQYGAGRVVFMGALFYASGIALMSMAETELALYLSAGVIIGIGLSGTTFPVVFGVISRSLPAHKRSWAMGVAMSIGSFGQFALLPGVNVMIDAFDWSDTLLTLSLLSVVMIPLSMTLREPSQPATVQQSRTLTLVLKEAATHRGFWLLSFGFFVCGFQVVFLGTHLPAFLMDAGLGIGIGSISLALIGLFNIPGSYIAGHLGGRLPKPQLLSALYMMRLLVISIFLVFPISTWSVYIFSIAMGFLWLSTVPLTNGTVASLFGVKDLSMLGGIVFLFHQLGAFLGGWAGGYLYDLFGDYDLVWMIAIVLSLIAAALNYPVKERAEPLATAH